jgi:biopolymer transport protein ExbD
MRSTRRVLRELERNEFANRGEPPINLVPMIDVLVVLVLYLLVATIFKQFTILQLNLPGPAQAVASDQPPPLELTVTLRRERLEVSDRAGTVRLLPNAAAGYDLAGLGQLLAEVKRRVPDEDSVTLLLEPDIAYERLVQVMDAARVFPAGTDEARAGLTMFPVIAIGDAPKLAPAPAGGTP